MPQSNYQRLINLAEETFAVKSDPNQLDVDQEIIERLLKIHPATVSEFSDEKGPVAWLLVIPTTMDLMNKFLAKEVLSTRIEPVLLKILYVVCGILYLLSNLDLIIP